MAQTVSPSAVSCEVPADMALLVSIAKPFGLAHAKDGSLYISDSRGHRVWKLTTDGRLTPFAGTGEKGSDGDGGPAAKATLNLPTGLALGSDGSLYIAESGGHKVRRVAPDGSISTYAGKGADPLRGKNPDYSGDNGPAVAAGLNEPWGLALDEDGNLYIADRGNGKVRKVTAAGVITTAVGTHQFGAKYEEGILATDADLWGPTGVAVGPDGALYLADPQFRRVFRVGADGRITTFAREGLNAPSGLAFDSAGNLYVSDTGSNLVMVIDRTGRMRTLAGSPTALYLGDGGLAAEAKLSMPWGLAPDDQGGLYVADAEHFRVRKIDQGGRIETVAGNGVLTYPEDSVTSGIRPGAVAVGRDGSLYYIDHRDSGSVIIRQWPDGRPSTIVSSDTRSVGGIVISSPLALALDPEERLYVSMMDRIVRIEADGRRTHVAGNGAPGFAGDGGPAAKAAINAPVWMSFDASGTLYFSDARNSRVRKITPDGTITTVAGNGQEGYSGDGGPATNASLKWPADLALDQAGNLYINDSNNDRVRRVAPDGTISTVAGNGRFSPRVDSGEATKVAVEAEALQTDDEGNLYIATNERLFKVTKDGALIRVGGADGYGPWPAAAPAMQVRLSRPVAMARDALGNLYLSDSEARRIWRITPDGLMTAVAGPMFGSFSQIPYMPSPWIESPQMVVADGKGNVYIGDTRNEIVYHVSPDGRARVLMTFDGPKKDYGVVVVGSAAGPYGLALDPQGNLLVVGDNKVYKVSPDGQKSVVAGNGSDEVSGDGGSALKAGMWPSSIAAAADGTLYLGDSRNYLIRRVTPDGTISTYFKSPTGTRLYPEYMAVDPDGNLYVASNTMVRKVAPDGTLTVVAGSQNSLAKPAQDGAKATEGTFEFISGIALDAEGALYIADAETRRIYRVGPDGIVNTVAGGPEAMYTLNDVTGLSVDPRGNLWFTETEKGRVRMAAPDGKVTTLSMSEPAKLHPAAVARAEAKAAVVARAAALQSGAPLSGAEVVAQLTETVRQGCPTASEAYVLGLLEAALRSGRVRQTPAILDALAEIDRRQGGPAKRILLKVGDLNAEVAGQPVTLDVPPQLVGGRTLVPLRFLVESLGAQVAWDAAARRITITAGRREIVLQVDSRGAMIDGEWVELDVAPMIIDGRTMVPLRFVSEQLGATLKFDPADRSIEITAQE